MSTRCQVKVTNGKESLTLYHHTDGYPSYMLPLIKKAWEKYGKEWEGARVYKVASMLCTIDPVVFEPLDYHDLHGDIEYYYLVNCKGESHIGTKPVWEVTTNSVDFDEKNSDKDRLTELDKIQVDKITAKHADKIEQQNE